MRVEAPIAFVPQLESTIFTKRDDIFSQEQRIDVFSSHQPAGLMNTLMGHNMMRKDGDAHMSERGDVVAGDDRWHSQLYRQQGNRGAAATPHRRDRRGDR